MSDFGDPVEWFVLNPFKVDVDNPLCEVTICYECVSAMIMMDSYNFICDNWLYPAGPDGNLPL